MLKKSALKLVFSRMSRQVFEHLVFLEASVQLSVTSQDIHLPKVPKVVLYGDIEHENVVDEDARVSEPIDGSLFLLVRSHTNDVACIAQHINETLSMINDNFGDYEVKVIL